MIKKAPITFKPYFKDVIWGGNRICAYKGISQQIPNIGESWEISEVPGHESVVEGGEYSGMNLSQLISRFHGDLLGEAVYEKYEGRFPLLIKLIDANDNLSVQVHPDDKLAMERHQSLGKSEMWYIINSENGAKIYAGLNKEISPQEYLERIEAKTFTDIVAVHNSYPGDVFYIPAGRVHSIGAGNMLVEIQESSDITYRIYDYDRKDSNGQTRELHTQLAKDAIDYHVYNNYKNAPLPEDVADCELLNSRDFQTRRVKLHGEQNFEIDINSFTVVICIAGVVHIVGEEGETILSKGKTALLPARLNKFKLQGDATLIMARSNPFS